MTPDATASEEKGGRGYWGFVIWPALFTFAVVSLLATGCSHVPRDASQMKQEGARLTEGEAVRIAEEKAQLEGRNLNEYRRAEAYLECTSKKKRWLVFFGCTPSTVSPVEGVMGRDFFVEIDDRTGRTRLIPGK